MRRSVLVRSLSTNTKKIELQWSNISRRYLPSEASAGAGVVLPQHTIPKHTGKLVYDSFATGLQHEQEAHWIRLFDSALRNGDISSAKETLRKVANSRALSREVLEACYGALIVALGRDMDPSDYMQEIIQSDQYGLSGGPPSSVVALALHQACAANRRDVVNKLIQYWSTALDRGLEELYRNSSILTTGDRIMIENKQIDDKNIEDLEHCRDYMKYYDSIAHDDMKRRKFERDYEMINLRRQRERELENFDTQETQTSSSRVSKSQAALKLWQWGSDIEKYLRQSASRWSNDLEKLRPVAEVIGFEKLGMVVSQHMVQMILKSSIQDEIHSHYVSNLSLRLGEELEQVFKQQLATAGDHKGTDIIHSRTDGAAQLQVRRRFTDLYWGVSSVEKWTRNDKIKVGAALLSVVLNVLRVDLKNPHTGAMESKQAFWHTFEFKAGKKIGVIRPHELMMRQITKHQIQDLVTYSSHRNMPMLVKPRPWTGIDEGGFLYSSLSLLSTTPYQAADQKQYVDRAIKAGNMDLLLEALDGISATAWGVNRRVLSVLMNYFESGESVFDIPGEFDKQEILPIDPKAPKQERVRARRHNQIVLNQQYDRMGYKAALDTARGLATRGERFYYCNQIDFRGRVYPVCSTGFTHLGQDSIRALLQFWYGKPLGQGGLRWLKIHLANMFGHDKVSNNDRERFVDDHMPQVLATADDPMSCDWWKMADKPFQTLAACFEVAGAVRCHSGSSKYISRIPVNQDGSCNGLQHYAALGGDLEGAKQVNMVPASEPRDVYSKVRDRVSELIAKDESKIARVLDGKITRKIVKQPVMTTVYGVTQYGAVLQVKNQLEALNLHTEEFSYGQCASYITEKIFQVRRQLFLGSSRIQHWLETCAARICRSVDVRTATTSNSSSTPVIWTTPLGLPVVQPYRKAETITISTELQSLILSNPYRFAPVDTYKQKNGIAPNFIHSLDSTHMFFSALSCQRAGIAFAAVHDSFWTHASNVDDMNRVLRREFVNLHSSTIGPSPPDQELLLEQLKNEFDQRSQYQMQLVQIPADSQVGQQVAELRKERGWRSFSEALKGELALERINATSAARQRIRNTPWVVLKRALADGVETPVYFGSYDNSIADSSKDKEVLDYFSGEPVPVLERSSKSVFPIWVPVRFPQVPSRGDYSVEQVVDSEYFFS